MATPSTRDLVTRRLASLPALDYRTSHRRLVVSEREREEAQEGDPGLEQWVATLVPQGWRLEEDPATGGDLVLRPWVAGP